MLGFTPTNPPTLQLQDNPNRSSREVKALTTQHIKTLNEQIHHLQKW